MIILMLLGYYLIGLFGFIYWWKTEFNLLRKDFYVGLFISIIGPLTWIMGYFIHKKK